MSRWIAAPAMLVCLLAAACSRFGQVNQGRVVAYDKPQGLLTLISDSNYRNPGHPRFDSLPPDKVHIPGDPAEMGPEPAAGKLLELGWNRRQATYFDSASQTLRTVSYTPVERYEKVFPDDPRVHGRQFPLVDREKNQIVVYSAAERVLAVLSVSPELMALPEETWRVGDDVRYYYKDPSQALRLMNVTRTDLNKGGK